MDSEFGIFAGLGWVHSSALVDNLGFGRVRSSVCPYLGLGLAFFRPNMFEVWFWSKNRGSLYLYLDSIQHYL